MITVGVVDTSRQTPLTRPPPKTRHLKTPAISWLAQAAPSFSREEGWQEGKVMKKSSGIKYFA